MDILTFIPAYNLGSQFYFSNDVDHIQIICRDDNRYYIKLKCGSDSWEYPYWATDGFNTLNDAQSWLNQHDWKNCTIDNINRIVECEDSNILDFKFAMKILGFNPLEDNPPCNMIYELSKNIDGKIVHMFIIYNNGVMRCEVFIDGNKACTPSLSEETCRIDKVIKNVETFLINFNISIISSMLLTDIDGRQDVVTAAINTRDLAKKIARVKSSNVWGYTINVKDRKSKFGDVLVQFKDKHGGAGDIYIYYDVPVLTYRRWHSAKSKGHYFWQYIRNYFKYSKLTGDKKGKLHNAVN